MLKYDAEVAAAIAHWRRALGVVIDRALVHAVIEKESSHGLALESVEPGGHRSYGPMMVLDTTAVAFGVKDPTALKNPWLGIWYGVRALGEELVRFPGDVERAISAYNAGADTQRLSTGRFPNQSYVDQVVTFWRRFRSMAVQTAPAAAVVALGLLVLLLVSRRRRLALR